MADLSTITLPNGNQYNLKDSTARTNISNKVSKSGDIMTGALELASNKFFQQSTAYSLNVNNSDVVGVNALYFADSSDGQSQGINFIRDDSHYDTLRAYNGKVYFTPYRPKNGTATDCQLYYMLPYQQGTTDISVRPLIAQARANRLAFLPADQVIIEKTTDGGATWEDANVSDANKIKLFNNVSGSVQIPLLNGEKSTNCGIRITLTGMKYNVPSNTQQTLKYNYWNSNYVLSQQRYFNVRQWWFWLSANTDTIRLQIQNATGANPNNWINVFNIDFGMTGWSGSDWIRAGNGATFGGGANQTGNYWNWRLIFWSRMKDNASTFASTSIQTINTINCFGDNVWGKPNNLMANDHLYSWNDVGDAIFAKKVTATGGFIGDLTGKASDVATQGAATNSTARHIWFSDSNTETKRAHSDSLKYTPSTNTISANISGNASTVNSHTVNSDVPSDAVFTDHTYTASTISIGSASTGTAISADDITAWTTNTPTAVTPATVVTSASGASAAVSNGVLTITNGSFSTGAAATVTPGTTASLSYTSRSIPNISVTSKNVVSSITSS